MRGAIVVSWGNSVRGREKLAIDTLMRAAAYADEQAKAGRIESHEEYIASDGNVSDEAGFMIVRGSFDALRELQEDREWRKLLFTGASVAENFSIRTFRGGNEESVQDAVGLALEVESELGLL